MVDAGDLRRRLKTRARFVLDGAEASAKESLRQVATPEPIRGQVEQATRGGQIIAFLLLGPVVMVSLEIIVVFNELMTEIIGTQSLGAQQDPIFAWLITAITGGAYVLAAWAWFQFVRTAAFGELTW